MNAGLLTICAALGLAAPAAAAPQPPMLIVAIAVDQLSADLFAEYRPQFQKGLKRLSQGVVFPSGYQSHAATETCPGHATILTGARPSRSGIIGNSWFDLTLTRADKKVYCAEDPRQPGTDSGANYIVSPTLLKVPTLGDRLKARNPATRVVSVAGKDRSAVMMGGHATDAVWFWKDGAFRTLADRTAPPPAAVAQANARAAALIARPPVRPLPALCRSRSAPVAVGASRTVGTLAAAKAGDASGFRTAGQFDSVTADIAIGLLKEMKLGRGAAPDVLAIGLSATDYVGHGFGTEGAEMCAQMVALDEAVGRILDALDASGARYAVVLTADHGGHDLPERNRARGFADAERVDPKLNPKTVGATLAAQLGLSGDLLFSDGPFGDWYLSRDIPAPRRAEALQAARALLAGHRQVAAVFTADELRAMPEPRPPVDEWTLAERARASFDAERSGDFLVFLKPHVTPIADTTRGAVATHGSPWAYDRRVPILFWQTGMRGFEQPLPVETVDILPTLAALIGLPIPAAEIDGRCLDLDPGAGTTCP